MNRPKYKYPAKPLKLPEFIDVTDEIERRDKEIEERNKAWGVKPLKKFKKNEP
jgi:hypothetical protein